jgi:RNA polymerase sigma-70 factor, ECF subfamily
MAGSKNNVVDGGSRPEDVMEGGAVPGDVDLLNAQDVAWMEQVADGDERAFRLLVERHQHAVVGMVARMLGDVHEAEDIAQQVFVRVWQAAAKWRPEAKFTTWLFTIVRNQVFNESRRRSRKKETSLEERMENHPEIMSSDESLAPDEVMEKGEWHRKIDAAIASLPEQQRMAVVLRTFEGKDYEEIAQIMDTSVSSLKSLLFRARGTLRMMLQEDT